MVPVKLVLHELFPKTGYLPVILILNRQKLSRKGFSHNALSKLHRAEWFWYDYLGLPRLLVGIVWRLVLVVNLPALFLHLPDVRHGLHGRVTTILTEVYEMLFVLAKISISSLFSLGKLLIVYRLLIRLGKLSNSVPDFSCWVVYERHFIFSF
jgi:hypothetical protein